MSNDGPLIKKLMDVLPFGIWLTPREVREFGKKTGLRFPQVKASLREAVRQGVVERRPISFVAEKKDRAIVEELSQNNLAIRQFHKNLNRPGGPTPKYQYRVIKEYEIPDRRANPVGRKLTPAQALYVIRNPDGLRPCQLAMFLPVTENTILYLQKGKKCGFWYLREDPKYDLLTDDEVREAAFPDGTQIIPKAKRSGRLRRGKGTFERVPDPEDQWDVTNFD